MQKTQTSLNAQKIKPQGHDNNVFKTRVPVKQQYIRQFIIVRYGMGQAEIDITKRTTLGILVTLACQKIGYLHTLPRTEIRENECVTLLLPDSLKNHFIHPNKVQAISRMLETLFEEAFRDCIESCVMLGVSDYHAVDYFMEKYGITENMIGSDTLRKKWRDHCRYLKRKLQKMEMI